MAIARGRRPSSNRAAAYTSVYGAISSPVARAATNPAASPRRKAIANRAIVASLIGSAIAGSRASGVLLPAMSDER
jgi:hypothetical protein